MSVPSSFFGNLVHILLWFLPEEKRRRWQLGLLIALAAILALLLAFLIVQRIGPIAQGPVEDPIERLNRVGADLSPNAADLYREAIRTRTEPPPGIAWQAEISRSAEPLSPELVQWLEENTESIQRSREASGIEGCHFPLRRGRTTVVDPKSRNALKRQAKFIGLRARLAAEQQDLETFDDCLRIITGISRHVPESPGVVGCLQEMGTRAVAMELCLVPFTWPALSSAQRTVHAAVVQECLAPLPDFSEALVFDREEMCWLGAEVGLADAGWCYPSRRWYGEIDRALRPYYELAAQPVEKHFDPANPVRCEIEDMRRRSAASRLVSLNFPRCGAEKMVSGLLPVIDLRFSFIAWQRGLRTVVDILAHEARVGRLPESLAEIGGEDVIDPFTGNRFAYRVTEEGFVLYSAGFDRDDDGGKHHERFGNRRERGRPATESLPPDGDFVFWPLPEAEHGE